MAMDTWSLSLLVVWVNLESKSRSLPWIVWSHVSERVLAGDSQGFYQSLTFICPITVGLNALTQATLPFYR